jgi:predicted metalloprotease with PDZ domain
MLHYTLSLDEPSNHLFTISIAADTNGADHLEIEFTAWSPGRYFIYDFSRNIQQMRAYDHKGHGLPIEKTAKGRWRVTVKGTERATITYRMFGNTLSGTFSQLDDRHAAINGPSVFGYIVDRNHEPIELQIQAPDHWKVFTSLKKARRGGSNVWRATNYDVLIDSPIEIGTPIVKTFTYRDVRYHIVIDIAGSPDTIRSRAMQDRLEQYAKDTEAIVRTYVDTFGDPEFKDYFFLVNIDPYAASGDGMEHLASTRLVANAYITDDDNYLGLIDTTSHEFFHIWNVKRLRPAELGPFDYSTERYTTLLWFAEGFTQYYGHMMVRRAGVWQDKQLYKQLASEFNTVDRSPGRHHRNLRESSFDTWLMASARSPMGATSNIRNTIVNYYNKGALVAFMLDMELRRITNGRKSLDDVIRHLYHHSYEAADHGEYFLRGNGYTQDDVYDAVAAVAGRSMRPFLRHAIESTDEINYGKYLKHIGLELVRGKTDTGSQSKSGKEGGNLNPLYTGMVTSDMKTRFAGEFVTVANVIEGSPAADAGISGGDMILAIDGERIDKQNWKAVMDLKQPGNKLEITLFRGPRLMTITVRGERQDTRPYQLVENARSSAAQKRARKKWLDG